MNTKSAVERLDELAREQGWDLGELSTRVPGRSKVLSLRLEVGARDAETAASELLAALNRNPVAASLLRQAVSYGDRCLSEAQRSAMRAEADRLDPPSVGVVSEGDPNAA
jgi:hypothetical protein